MDDLTGDSTSHALRRTAAYPTALSHLSVTFANLIGSQNGQRPGGTAVSISFERLSNSVNSADEWDKKLIRLDY